MKRTLALVGIVGLFVAFAAGCSGQSTEEPAQGGQDLLSLKVQDSKELSGSFARGMSVVTFESRLKGVQGAITHLQVNGLDIDADVDLEAGQARLDGHNRALTQEDREALLALQNRLNEKFAGKSLYDLAAQDQVLMRAVAYYAEAPVGMTLGVLEAKAPKEAMTDSRKPRTATRACQESGEDGILYFSSCTYQTRWIEHDATSHCFSGSSIYTGKGGVCRGQCGQGCSGVGTLGIWTYDCGDHDWCVAHDNASATNPWDSNCGDEWSEASDDFMLGWPNKGTGC